MRIVVVGAGKSGTYLAEKLRGEHELAVIEQRLEKAERLRAMMPDVDVVEGDACEPSVLDQAKVGEADLLAAMTGDDEDNLVVSWLAKTRHGVRNVYARVNHPKNEWLFGENWGVDVAVSSAAIVHQLVESGVHACLLLPGMAGPGHAEPEQGGERP